MQFSVIVKVEYKSGRYRTLNWDEKNPKFVSKEGENEVRRPATAKELKMAISESFYKLLEENAVRSFEDSPTGKSVLIRFEDVSEVEVTVEEGEEDEI